MKTFEWEILFLVLKPVYVRTTNGGRCCLEDGTEHQTCNFELDLQRCKDKCNEDPECKGYYQESPKQCAIASTSSNVCLGINISYPLTKNPGNDGALSYNPKSPPCPADDYTPCFIKQGNN